MHARVPPLRKNKSVKKFFVCFTLVLPLKYLYFLYLYKKFTLEIIAFIWYNNIRKRKKFVE